MEATTTLTHTDTGKEERFSRDIDNSGHRNEIRLRTFGKICTTKKVIPERLMKAKNWTASMCCAIKAKMCHGLPGKSRKKISPGKQRQKIDHDVSKFHRDQRDGIGLMPGF